MKKLIILFILLFSSHATAQSLVSPNNMTSNVLPSPYVASASSSFLGDLTAAYKAFDGTALGWFTSHGTTTGWLKIYLGSSQVACAYKITGATTDAQSPMDWTFDGSNNDSDWITLDTQADITFTASEEKTFIFSNENAYGYYRLNITENNGDVQLLSIRELKIYASTVTLGTTPIVTLGTTPTATLGGL